MASIKERASASFGRLRERRPFIDHLVRMQQHYGETNAGQQAGAVTYFGFLSFFPILALAFFVVGIVSNVYPGANADLRSAITTILPGIIGQGDGQIQLSDIRTFSGLAGLVGVLGVLYSGLGWISALRGSLTVVFATPKRDQPNFVFGKLRDLATLAAIGLVLLVAVGVTGVVSGFSGEVLDLLGLDTTLGWLVRVVAALVGLAANALLFYAMFRLLAEPQATGTALWQGALLGAIGFEVLKQISGVLIASTKGQPAFQAFGIALILVVWINYFSRLVLYSAAFAHTARSTRVLLAQEAADSDSAVSTPASVMAAATMAGSGSEPALRSERTGSWMHDFVDKIDAADPDEVGEASAEAARLAREREQATARQRLLALGAVGSVAGLIAVLRRRRDR